MIQVDTLTMFIMNVAVSATLAITVGSVARRDTKDGLIFWSLALASATVSFVLLAARGVVPDFLSMVFGNGLQIVMLILYGEALCEFQKRRMPRVILWGGTAGFFLFFTTLLENHVARVVTHAVVAAPAFFVLSYMVWQKHKETVGRGQYFLMAGFILIGSAVAYRGIGTAMGWVKMAAMLDNNFLQAVTFLFSSICMVLVSIGMVLMTKERADEKNRLLAMHDELTGLANRRFTLEALNRLMVFCQRNQAPLSVMVMDIDHFKKINDTYGHHAGDEALKKVSNKIASGIRVHDIAGRIGGEEFVVIAPSTDVNGAKVLAERLRRSIAEEPIVVDKGTAIPVTISIGVHSRVPKEGEQSSEMVIAADKALYASKSNGRNRVTIGE